MKIDEKQVGMKLIDGYKERKSANYVRYMDCKQ